MRRFTFKKAILDSICIVLAVLAIVLIFSSACTSVAWGGDWQALQGIPSVAGKGDVFKGTWTYSVPFAGIPSSPAWGGDAFQGEWKGPAINPLLTITASCSIAVSAFCEPGVILTAGGQDLAKCVDGKWKAMCPCPTTPSPAPMRGEDKPVFMGITGTIEVSEPEPMPTGLTVEWTGEIIQRCVVVAECDPSSPLICWNGCQEWTGVELGLQSDGIVVWRMKP